MFRASLNSQTHQALNGAHVNVLMSELLVADSEEITSNHTRAPSDVSRCCATKPSFRFNNKLVGDELLSKGRGGQLTCGTVLDSGRF